MTKPIVSSAHLVSEKSAELSEYEYGLITASNTFNRWIVRCAAAAGLNDLGPLDVLVLHSINHRNRAKKLADLCFVLNIEDTHTVAYACRKLQKLGLIDSERRKKESFYSATKEGQPIRPKSESIKLTSTSSGTLCRTCSPGAKSVATRMGSAAFFAPLIATVP